jgi:hypothetical protein
MAKIEIEGLNELIATISDIPKDLEPRVIEKLSQVAFDYADTAADSHSKSGNLVKSLYNRDIANGREVGHDPQVAPYAAFVVFGTAPHTIQPRDRKALRWVAGNDFVFAKFVNHPGYAGDNYMQRAADEAIGQFESIVDAVLKEKA